MVAKMEKQVRIVNGRFVTHFVIAGLDPAIHLLREMLLRRLMDARIKSGHDISFVDTASRSRGATRPSCA
jgi:hypothetical protein